jgi:hypothetical protein
MYPTLIILLVALQKSQLEHQFTYPSYDSPTATLPFSVRTRHLHTSKDSDTRSTLQATPDIFNSSALPRHGSETDMSVVAAKWRSGDSYEGSGNSDGRDNAD